MEYNYRLVNTSESSKRYGNCEVCDEFCGEIYHQTESREYKPGRFTYANCSDLFGHKDCLIAKRRYPCQS